MVSDNSPFGAQEFAEFAKQWEFKHSKISPRYSQSNGRAENADKTAKRLMAKALEANTYPFLSLLDWRNIPSSQLGKAPVEVLYNCKTRTRLPIANNQLLSHTAPAAATALAKAKQLQAKYYNRTALEAERAILPVGKTVRFKHDTDWRLAQYTMSSRTGPMSSNYQTVPLVDGPPNTSGHQTNRSQNPLLTSWKTTYRHQSLPSLNRPTDNRHLLNHT